MAFRNDQKGLKDSARAADASPDRVMNGTDGFSLRQFLGILRRRGWIVAQAVVILAAVAVLASLRSTHQYEASSVLLVGASKQPLGELISSGDELTASAAARLVRTRDVAERVRKATGNHHSVDDLLARVDRKSVV